MIKRALISVSDKNGIVEFSKKLYEKGVEILSTGGTAKILRENGIEVIDVSDYTGFPEMMNGRVKTLHPKVHGGLLALRDNEEHIKAAKENGIDFIDIVVVNLYPFESAIKKEGVTLEEAIENIDIGGPSMLRSAAKNFRSVTVITDPNDYEVVLKEFEESGDTKLETRRKLAEEVFKKTAHYDSLIANYLTEGKTEHIIIEKVSDLRYGENPHQKAAFYKMKNEEQIDSLPNAKQLQGKELSYNNIMDADGAINVIRGFDVPAVAFIKHANPCGAAIGETIEEAFEKAHSGDPKSAFGGIISMNRKCTTKIAESFTGKFIEIIIAPEYEEGALEIFKGKKNLRVMVINEIKPLNSAKTFRKVVSGLLIQDVDTKIITKDDIKVVTEKIPTEKEITDMLFGWSVIKNVKSNAIVLIKDGMTVGIGAGQMSRVDAAELAIKKAMGREKDSILISDAFFPFADSIEAAAEAGIKAIIQPGGSIRDEEVIKAANKAGIAMVFTGTRAFLH